MSRVYRRGKVYYLDFVDAQGQRQRQATDASTKGAAEVLLAEVVSREERVKRGLEVAVKNPKHWTVAQGFEWWMTTIGSRQAQHDRVGWFMRKHLVGAFAGLQLEHATAGQVTAWLDERAAQGLGTNSVNHLRAHISSVFRHLIERDLFFGENPVKRTKKREVEDLPPRVLPYVTIRLLLEGSPPQWRLIFMLAIFAGLRRSEIARLTWSNIDLETGVIVVRNTKKKRVRVVPIHDELLAELKAAKGSGIVVARKSWDHSALVLRNAMARAGAVIPEDVAACFHSLRHTWGSRCVECGIDAALVELIGWGAKKGSVFQQTYLRLTPERLRAAINRLTWPTPGAVIQLGTNAAQAVGGRDV